MVRVSGLQRQLEKGVLKSPPDGMTPQQQLEAIRQMLLPDLSMLYDTWHKDILPKLATAGIYIHLYTDLPDQQKEQMRKYFIDEIFPVLTPLVFDSAHPFPFISNRSLNLAIVVRNQNNKDFFARVKVPTNLFSRLIKIPPENSGESGDDASVHYVYLEDLISANLDMLFPGMEVIASSPFRITRDADIDIEVDDASDLLTTVEEVMEQRARGKPVRIELECSMHDGICHMLEKKLGVTPNMLYRVGHPIGMADLMQLLSLDRPDLKDIPFQPIPPIRSG